MKVSLFNKFKRKVIGVGQTEGKKTTDEEFENAHTRILSYSADTSKILTDMKGWEASAGGLCSALSQTSTDFEKLFSSEDTPEFALASEAKQTVESFELDFHNVLGPQLGQTALQRLSERVAVYQDLKRQADEREEARSQMDYYLNKLDSIKATIEKNCQTGKSNVKEEDRKQRNEEKLQETSTKYTLVNNELKEEYAKVEDNRFQDMEYAMNDFIAVQKNFVTNISDAVEDFDARLKAMQEDSPPKPWGELIALPEFEE